MFSDFKSIKAVLGPTNTGKTYLAIDRMLGHETGMIGFPLRLLARENYDRVVRLRGAGSAALITGEERIIPKNPRYYLCTVEAMPKEISVAFLAIDEIQLCADAERGHIFTERLLGARGTQETMFLGAETMGPILRRLVPSAEYIRRERYSKLTYVGPKKLNRLPPRSAVVAFSNSNVYAMAEVIRRQRGGAAVVLGALSPRTRNAQVGMYEAGEVDYLVATDAIGMGLNMGIDHVSFSSIRKFDGVNYRYLLPTEIAQVAGRAGRYLSDGTFGPTADIEPFDPDLVTSLEDHKFDSLNSLFWRSTELDFNSPTSLKRSLESPPPLPLLRRARAADDYSALISAISNPKIVDMASNPESVSLLWDTCRIPDFSGDRSGSHLRLVIRIFRFLMSSEARIPTDWVARSFSRLDRLDGNIDTLISRISNVRTWTYVSHRDNWLEDATSWQERTSALENKLSDVLHDRLTQRFVDRKTAVLVRRLREHKKLLAGVGWDGRVTVEGNEMGWLKGFHFVPDNKDVLTSTHLMAAINRALREVVSIRVASIKAADNDAFLLNLSNGTLEWNGAPLAKLTSGSTIVRPHIDILPSELLDSSAISVIRLRLRKWLDYYLISQIRPLLSLSEKTLDGELRGLIYRLTEGLGCSARDNSIDRRSKFIGNNKHILARAGIRVGVEITYMPSLLKGRLMPLKGLLWAVHRGEEKPSAIPDGGATSIDCSANIPSSWYLALGFFPVGKIAIRADLLERLLANVRQLSRDGPFNVNSNMMNTIGVNEEKLALILKSFGYVVNKKDKFISVSRKKPGKRTSNKIRKQKNIRAIDPNSPFAILARLKKGPHS
ncbi:MAG: disulfide oxidoreductase [Rhodospirillaceae bacterium]|nr:disulfide oxidoreductase [Rhodospirillaceae bacterium]